MGIEPTSSAWKAEVLPLNYTRVHVGRLNLISFNRYDPSPGIPGGGGRIRTSEG